MKNPAIPADTLDMQTDRQIGELAASASGVASPTADTSAGDMTPLEAATLDLSRDLRNLLRLAGELKRQGEAMESFARALAADMERMKAAVRSSGSRT